MIERDWNNCYSDGWNGEIIPDAYAHPAKFARGLIRRIYAHALERGYLKPGDTVLDPFGGVGLGALDAITYGLNWTGVELEQRFVEWGKQNITFWEHKRRGQNHFDNLPALGKARLIQGDSRELARIIGEVGGCVSSPPYAESNIGSGDPEAEQRRLIEKQKAGAKFTRYDVPQNCQASREERRYTQNPANLGNLPARNFSAAVTSPPYAESVGSDDPDKRGCLYRDPKRRKDKTLTAEYGDSAGQLGGMKVVSSPPFEQSDMRKGGSDLARSWAIQHGRNPDVASMIGKTTSQPYGMANGQLGTETGDDFWQAARQIVEQVAVLLPPGSVAIWITKRFVRDKAIVEFSQQWAQLGEACGFETIEWIKAWLIEDRGSQYDLFGGLQEKTVKRSSFFRRLYENKYPENAIDWEDVIIQRRLP